MAEDNFTNKVSVDSCCSKEEKKKQPAASASADPAATQIKNLAEEHEEGWREHWDLLAALAILIVLLVLEYGFNVHLPEIPLLVINFIAWLLAGHKVLRLACKRKPAKTHLS